MTFCPITSNITAHIAACLKVANCLSVYLKRAGPPELRLLDLDGSISAAGVQTAQHHTGSVSSALSAETQEALARMQRSERGAWVLLTTHCFSGISISSSGRAQTAPSVCAEAGPYSIKQWPANHHVLCMAGKDGSLRLFDAHSCTELHVSVPFQDTLAEVQIDAER